MLKYKTNFYFVNTLTIIRVSLRDVLVLIISSLESEDPKPMTVAVELIDYNIFFQINIDYNQVCVPIGPNDDLDRGLGT